MASMKYWSPKPVGLKVWIFSRAYLREKRIDLHQTDTKMTFCLFMVSNSVHECRETAVERGYSGFPAATVY